MKIVARSPSGIKVLKEFVHLSSSDPITKTHQLNLHLAACSSLQRDAAQKELFFSASFTSSAANIEEIRQKFYGFLEDAQAISQSSDENQEVFHMNFDLFQHQ